MSGTPKFESSMTARGAKGEVATPVAETRIDPSQPERIAIGVDRDDPEGSADEIVNIAGHNGFIGLSWQKYGKQRTVVRLLRQDSGRLDVVVNSIGPDKDSTPRERVISIARLTEHFSRDISDGSITNIIMPNNQGEIAAGAMQSFDRDPNSWRMVPRAS